MKDRKDEPKIFTGVVAHRYNPRPWEAEAGGLHKFETGVATLQLQVSLGSCESLSPKPTKQ